MPELSIIVPIYNVEKYLPKCIDSILAQTFTDYELILIDDGSPDKCADIMREYEKRDERIVTIYQENKGVSAARNAGLRIAKGSYIGFVDPDDWVDSHMYEIMCKTAVAECADVVCCNIVRAWEDGRMERREIYDVPFYMDRNAFLIHAVDMPSSIGGYAANKIWRKERLTALFNETVFICEDILFLVENGKAIKSACYVNSPFYYYLQRENGATSNLKRFANALPINRELIELVEKDGQDVTDAYERVFLDECCLCCGWTKGERDELFDLSRKELRQYVSDRFIRIIKNKRIPLKEKVNIFKCYFNSLISHG